MNTKKCINIIRNRNLLISENRMAKKSAQVKRQKKYSTYIHC